MTRGDLRAAGAALLAGLGLAAGLAAPGFAAVTADRFGGFEDCDGYGPDAGRAAPAVARAYEALIVAQAPPSVRRPPLVMPRGATSEAIREAQAIRAAGAICLRRMQEEPPPSPVAGPALPWTPSGRSPRSREESWEAYLEQQRQRERERQRGTGPTIILPVPGLGGRQGGGQGQAPGKGQSQGQGQGKNCHTNPTTGQYHCE